MSPAELLRIAVDIIQAILVPFLGYAIRTVSELHKEIRALNGRLISIEQWKIDHVAEADRRFNDFLRTMRRMAPRDGDD